MTMYSDQTLLMNFADCRTQAERVEDQALIFLKRVERCHRSVMTAEALEDKIDALADLIAVSVAFNALGIAVDASSSAIIETAKGLARC